MRQNISAGPQTFESRTLPHLKDAHFRSARIWRSSDGPRRYRRTQKSLRVLHRKQRRFRHQLVSRLQNLWVNFLEFQRSVLRPRIPSSKRHQLSPILSFFLDKEDGEALVTAPISLTKKTRTTIANEWVKKYNTIASNWSYWFQRSQSWPKLSRTWKLLTSRFWPAKSEKKPSERYSKRNFEYINI